MGDGTTKAPVRTALYERHRAAGGKIVEFAGWEMPVLYSSILEEHRAVRERAGLFDVSHMGEIILTGPDREREADRLTTSSIAGRGQGEVQYALLLNDDAGVIDDVLVYKLEDRVLIVVNAVNHEKDLAWIRDRCGDGAVVTDESAETSQVAVQGPRSREILARVAGSDLAALPYYGAAMGEVAGARGVISRTGYTGELGFEIYVPWEDGPQVWDALLVAGRDEGIAPVGLGARDSLRLEMRYSLYGHELDEQTNPVEAGLGWVVRKKETGYIGKEAYLAAKAAPPKRKLLAFRLGERDIPRPGYAIKLDGREVGAVTSGGFSPTLRTGIAIGYVEAAVAKEKDGFTVRIRKNDAPARRQRGSFVPSSVKDEGED